MKKILGIMVLSLLWCNTSNSAKANCSGGECEFTYSVHYDWANTSCYETIFNEEVETNVLNCKDKDGHNLSPPLNGSGHTWHHSDELLHNIIKHGFVNLVKNYKGKMVGFGDKMSDKQIDSVLSYIKSHWEDEIYERQISISK